MKLRTDSQCRLGGREVLKPDTIYEAEIDGAGRITLVESAPREVPRATLSRRGGRTYLQSNRQLTNEDVRKAMGQVP